MNWENFFPNKNPMNETETLHGLIRPWKSDYLFSFYKLSKTALFQNVVISSLTLAFFSTIFSWSSWIESVDLIQTTSLIWTFHKIQAGCPSSDCAMNF